MIPSTTASPPMAQLVKLQVDENPYSTPKTLVVIDDAGNRYSNFELQRLGYSLRAHGILTAMILAIYVAAFWMLNGAAHEIGGLMLIGAMLLSVVLVLLTVMLAFIVFPFVIAILLIASMLVPVAWPFSFIAMHLWGRRTLKKHGMELGLIKGPQYVANLADGDS